MKKVAVILCGSGFKDGSEIRESVAVLWALSEEGAQVTIFAPDEPQLDVVNSLTGEVVPGERRNQLIEAARIARGQVRALKSLRCEDFDALILPGGFGAAKNLCTFARDGGRGKVHGDLQEFLVRFHAASKPLGAVCIAPAVLALAFPGADFELTVGEKGEAAQEIEKLGHRHFVKSPREWHTDRVHRIVTSPAYMYGAAELRDVFCGIRGLVRDVLALS